MLSGTSKLDLLNQELNTLKAEREKYENALQNYFNGIMGLKKNPVATENILEADLKTEKEKEVLARYKNYNEENKNEISNFTKKSILYLIHLNASAMEYFFKFWDTNNTTKNQIIKLEQEIEQTKKDNANIKKNGTFFQNYVKGALIGMAVAVGVVLITAAIMTPIVLTGGLSIPAMIAGAVALVGLKAAIGISTASVVSYLGLSALTGFLVTKKKVVEPKQETSANESVVEVADVPRITPAPITSTQIPTGAALAFFEKMYPGQAYVPPPPPPTKASDLRFTIKQK